MITKKDILQMLADSKSPTTPRTTKELVSRPIGSKEMSSEDILIAKIIRKIPASKNGKSPTNNELNFLIKEFIPSTESIVNEVIAKIKTLEGFNRIPVSAINMPERGQIDQRWHGGGSIVMYYDLSSKLDGTTKVFTIPTNSKIIQITSSSAPFVFRPTTDYTLSGTKSSNLTFTSGIDASTQLSQGQSIIIIYAK